MTAVSPSITVLLVDEDTRDRQTMRRLLSGDEDISVVGEAASAGEAIRHVRELQPQVVMLDMGLAQDSDIDITRVARAMAPDTRILVMTTCHDIQSLNSLIVLQVSGYLLKTATALEIRRAAHDAAMGRPVFSPEVAHYVLGLLRGDRGDSHGRQAARTSLTARQLEVLELIGQGLRNREIAGGLGIRIRTVEVHVEQILLKLGATNRTEAVLNAIKSGLLPEPVAHLST